MEIKIFVVLMVFSFLFLGGGILTANGLLRKKKRHLQIGIAMIVLSIVMTALGLGD